MKTLPAFVPVITHSRGLVVHLMTERRVWRTYGYTLCGRFADFGRILPGIAGDATCPVCRLKAGVGR